MSPCANKLKSPLIAGGENILQFSDKDTNFGANSPSVQGGGIKKKNSKLNFKKIL